MNSALRVPHSAFATLTRPTNRALPCPYVGAQSASLGEPPRAPMFLALILTIGALLFFGNGCARFTTTQTDLSYDDQSGLPLRTITTRVKAVTFWDSTSALANFKASQTDKTQSATVGSLNQSSTNNTAATLNALADLLNAVKTP